jgi:hypothetical protein
MTQPAADTDDSSRGAERRELWQFLRRGLSFAALMLAIDLAVPFGLMCALQTTGIGLHYALPAHQVLVLGASHLSFAVDDQEWTTAGIDVLHCSRDGQFAEFYAAFYDAYRRRHPAPSLMMIDAPFFMFQRSRYELLLALGDSFDLNDGFVTTLRQPTSRLYEYGEVFQLLPAIAYRRLRGEDREVPCGYASQLYADYVTMDLVRRGYPAKDDGGRHDYVADGWSVADNPMPAASLRRLVDRLRRDGVTLALVETPEFIDSQRSTVGRDLFYADLEALAPPGPGIVHLRQADMRSVDVADPRQFYDGGWNIGNSHLSRAGSQPYTRELLGVVRGLLAARDTAGAPSR